MMTTARSSQAAPGQLGVIIHHNTLSKGVLRSVFNFAQENTTDLCNMEYPDNDPWNGHGQ